MLTRELAKIRRNLGGVRKMNRLPAALVLIDARKEVNGVREARSMDVPTVCLIDSDSDPTLVDIPIPGNDDAMRAIELIVRELADAVEEGKKSRPEPTESVEVREGLSGGPRRRIRRGGPEFRGEPAPSAIEAAPPESVAVPATAPAESSPTGGEPASA